MSTALSKQLVHKVKDYYSTLLRKTFFFSVVKGEKIKSVHNTNIIPYSNYLILQLISISSTYPETKLCIYSEIFIHDIVYSPFSSQLSILTLTQVF